MKILVVFLSLLLMSSTCQTSNNGIYQFKITALDSDEIIDIKAFQCKKILIVNVASKCGYTSQYADLQKLYEKYKDKLVVIGFPCNQFMGQELAEESDIKSFCQKNYGVTFPITTKIDVHGKDQHPIYEWLTQKEKNGVGDYKISWNFNKFMIDEQGNLLEYFPSSTKPMDEAILKHL